jgi:hypothetical protein
VYGLFGGSTLGLDDVARLLHPSPCALPPQRSPLSRQQWQLFDLNSPAACVLTAFAGAAF